MYRCLRKVSVLENLFILQEEMCILVWAQQQLGDDTK